LTIKLNPGIHRCPKREAFAGIIRADKLTGQWIMELGNRIEYVNYCPMCGARLLSVTLSEFDEERKVYECLYCGIDRNICGCNEL